MHRHSFYLSLAFVLCSFLFAGQTLAFSLPNTQVAQQQAELETNLTLGTKTSHSIGGQTYSFNLQKLTDSHATISVYSDFEKRASILELEDNETKIVDTNGDGYANLQLTYYDKVNNTTAFVEAVTLSDELERKNALTINDGGFSTPLRTVLLSFNVDGAIEMSISNTAQDTGTYESFTQYKKWTLPSGDGIKTVYVSFKSADGTVLTSQDTISLVGQEFTPQSDEDAQSLKLDSFIATELKALNPEKKTTQEKQDKGTNIQDSTCPLDIGKAYKVKNSSVVYYISKPTTSMNAPCSKRIFTRAKIFLTHFDSWDMVELTNASTLAQIPFDSLKTMYLGPKFDPQYGAIVKSPADPKVYLLLGGKKYWINSASVFTKLGYQWDWIEDVDPSLLETYASGTQINATDAHPNYTLIKYKNSSKVYRLEPDPSNAEKQLKRHIKNAQVFEKLKYRWDRIVTIAEGEVYEDGEVLE